MKTPQWNKPDRKSDRPLKPDRNPPKIDREDLPEFIEPGALHCPRCRTVMTGRLRCPKCGAPWCPSCGD